MPAEEIAGCLAEGCLTLVFDLGVELFFPTRGRSRRATKRGIQPTPPPLWERLLSLSVWAVVLTGIVVLVWFVLFGSGS